jgi:exodeoxyribonuclease VII large subunit
MAHTATKTPTKAAELIIAHCRSFEENLGSLQNQIALKSQTLLNEHKEYLTSNNQLIVNKSREILYHQRGNLINKASGITSHSKQLMSNHLNKLENFVLYIKTFYTQVVRTQYRRLDHLQSFTNSHSPENILKKGFAIVRINNQVISDPEKIKPGQDMSVILSNTEIKSTVKSKNKYDGKDFNL